MVAEGVLVMLGVIDMVNEGVTDTLRVIDGVIDTLRVIDGVIDMVAEGVTDKLRVIDGVTDTLGVKDTDGIVEQSTTSKISPTVLILTAHTVAPLCIL
jgi:hypothetical protein